MSEALPVFYSFRRCPYAMRARLALSKSALSYEHREILLKNKPKPMLLASAKATVPVLVVGDMVLDESLDIMMWALEKNDPDNWLRPADELEEMLDLIKLNDGEFKDNLDRYKYSSRHAEGLGEAAREKALDFLEVLEAKLKNNPQLFGSNVSLADMAIFPFIRQFGAVNWQWFNALPFPKLQLWLKGHMDSGLFASVMTKHDLWSQD
jgi:glutathione S-transferase